MKTRVGRPQYTGITTYRDPLGRFEFKHSADWVATDLDDDRDGVLMLAEEDEPATYFAVWVREVGTHVRAEDMEVLQSGLDEGLAQLPGVRVDRAHDEALDNLIKLERCYTFCEDGPGGPVRKRRTWTMYADTWQFVVIFQGSSVDEYAYWEPMGNFAFARFELPQELWFATDSELGVSAVEETRHEEAAGEDAASDEEAAER